MTHDTDFEQKPKVRIFASRRVKRAIAVFVTTSHVIGLLCSVDAIMRNRTAQGAVAWSLSLVTVPYVMVPIYLVFGQQRFEGLVQARQGFEDEIEKAVDEVEQRLAPFVVDFPERIPDYEALKRLAESPFLTGNEVELLIDGEATFDSIIEGIGRARDYVLVEFYIVRDDQVGNRLKDALIERANAGVEVFFVTDGIGSRKLSASYQNDLRRAGVSVTRFLSTRGSRNRFQLNFRNHRKIVVVDGREAWVGGHNVGDDYLGLDDKVGPWRDTHVRILGPAALLVQATFLADWLWAARSIPAVNWEPANPPNGDVAVMILSTGPADEIERAKLFFVHALNAAKDRVWIATPYFVPDDAVSSALRMAALRGVDVRVIVPQSSDNFVVDLASRWFIEALDGLGIRFYEYREGFMHQKMMLVDNLLSVVGSANFDNRSFRLQFEVNALIADETFAAKVEDMLERDLARSRQYQPEAWKEEPFWYRLAVHSARLTAPLL